MEEQLIDAIVWNHWIDRDKHRIHEEYVSDDLYQDSEEDLPFGFHVTYNHGPQYRVEEPYRAPWHKDKAIEILEDEGYDALVDWVTEDTEEESYREPAAYTDL